MTPRRRRKRVLLGVPEANPFAAPVEDYAHNLLVGTALRRLDAQAMKRIASCDLMIELAGAGSAMATGDPWEDVDPANAKLVRHGLREHMRDAGRELRSPRAPAGPVAANLTLIGEALDLDDAHSRVLQFVVALHGNGKLKELTNAFGELTLPEAVDLIGVAAAIAPRDVRRALDPGGRLLASGLVSVDQNDSFPLVGKIELKAAIIDTLLMPGLDRRGLVARFLPEVEPTPLAWVDFAHVENHAFMAREVLAVALESRQAGVNILLHGPTGTGKTVLASLLAREIGVHLFAAGRSDQQDESSKARERLSSLLLGQRLVPRGRALLLFDEMEDLLGGPLAAMFSSVGLEGISKQWFNHLLETNPVPTIWITNSVDGIDPAFLRRFCFLMELGSLGPRQRARALRRHLGHTHRLASADVDAIAQRFTASPAQLASAVATARMLAADGQPDRFTIEAVLAPSEKLLTGKDPMRRRFFDVSQYRGDAVRSTDDVEAIAARLASWEPGSGPGVSLCFYGPPGTGKTEYVHYLAHRMGRTVLQIRASDLLSRWVGDTEQRIAAAFQQAEQEDALLLFDEADTFLRDRRQAQHSWEVSQVNEFLQQLEEFRGCVACTTNLREDLDPASLRRFIFKIEFGFLEPEQAMALFRSRFAHLFEAPLSRMEESDIATALARLDRLTPGDFAAVARRQEALREPASARALVAALKAEVMAKPGARRAVGF